jgi:hypothetical protein
MKVIITEEQFNQLISMDESRSNPDININQTFDQFFKRLENRFGLEDLFLSFRDNLYITDVNPNNKYHTPVGFYSYPLIAYKDKIDRAIINGVYNEKMFRLKFPYQHELKYMVFLHLENKEGILTSETPKEELDMYVNKIKNIYAGGYENIEDIKAKFTLSDEQIRELRQRKDIIQTNYIQYNGDEESKSKAKDLLQKIIDIEQQIKQLQKEKKPFEAMYMIMYYCDRFLDGTYSSSYTKDIYHETHRFWLLLYSIAQAMFNTSTAENRVTRMINIICRRIGINGFIDYEGKGFIHESEPIQAIFFKVKNLGQIFTYEMKDPKLRQLNNDEIVDSYDTKYIYLKNGLYAVKVPNGGTSYYIITDKNGRLFIKQRFHYVEAYRNKLIFVMDAYEKINFINTKKEYILDNFVQFQPKISYDNNGDLVMTDNKTNTVYVVDEDGNLINKYTEKNL